MKKNGFMFSFEKKQIFESLGKEWRKVEGLFWEFQEPNIIRIYETKNPTKILYEFKLSDDEAEQVRKNHGTNII